MIYVVDQNMMRSDALRALVDDALAHRFVIPDAALEEMTRHERWEEIVRGSFKILAPALDRTFFSAGVGELVRYELSNRAPVGRGHLLPDELCDGAREIVQAVVAGSERVGEVRRRVDACRREVAAERQGGQDLKGRMLAHVGRLKNLHGQELTSDIRSGRMNLDARLGLLKLLAERVVREFVSPDLPNSLRLSHLMTTRLVYASLWYQELWLAEGGLETAKAKTLANDDFDMEYALVSSFFDGLLSEDRRGSRCAADLKVMADPDAHARLEDALLDRALASGRIPRLG